CGWVCWSEPMVLGSEEAIEPQSSFPLSEGARRRRAVWSSRDDAFASYASRPPLDVLEPTALRAYVDHGLRDRSDGQVELKCRPEDEAAVYAMGVANGVYQRLAQVMCPPLVVCRWPTYPPPPTPSRSIPPP